MSISAWGVRKWLLKQPRGVLIKLTCRGVVQEVKIGKTQSLAKIGETVEAVAPELMELYDDAGVLLRALRPDFDADPASEQPKLPRALESDPETARFTHVAALLAKAYEHATTVAFGKLVDLFERLDARTESLETRLERTETMYRRAMYDQLQSMQDQAIAVINDAPREDDGEFKDQMLQTMFASWMQGKAAARAKPNGTPSAVDGNGKGT